MVTIETNQNKLHVISLWWLCITFVWPRGSKKLPTTAPPTDRKAIWRYYTLLRLYLALLFFISIETLSSKKNDNILSTFKNGKHLNLKGLNFTLILLVHVGKIVLEQSKELKIPKLQSLPHHLAISRASFTRSASEKLRQRNSVIKLRWLCYNQINVYKSRGELFFWK